MIKILLSIALPMLVLAFACAWKVKRRAMNIRTLEWVDVREATAPRLAGALLVGSLLLFGIAGTMALLGVSP